VALMGLHTLWSLFGLLQEFMLEFYNSNFVSQIYKIPQDLGIISPCQQDDMPHFYRFFVVWAPAQKVFVLDALILVVLHTTNRGWSL
jgi:hypothetical protein